MTTPNGRRNMLLPNYLCILAMLVIPPCVLFTNMILFKPNCQLPNCNKITSHSSQAVWHSPNNRFTQYPRRKHIRFVQLLSFTYPNSSVLIYLSLECIVSTVQNRWNPIRNLNRNEEAPNINHNISSVITISSPKWQ